MTQDRDYFVAAWHQTVISVFRGPATLLHVLNITDACKALLVEARGPVTYMGVIERTSPAPTETVRRELAAWSRDVVTKFSLATIVAEGGGFKNALVRAVGLALTVLVPHTVPFKFASNVEEGAALVAPFLSAASGGEAELIAVVADVRRRWESTL
ncbi:MAG: hypothetical protein WDO69_15145 [Pseudomonadota bacterium]